ncbi:MAG: hypothetical protein ABI607_10880 [Betaproteobacteria bacterium]
MNGTHSTWWQASAALLMALGLAACGVHAHDYNSVSGMPYVKGRLVQVDVYDRADGVALPVHAKNGRNYIIGMPGHEYAVRIRNCTGGRILVATSVDGVNVVSGETASPTQTGYVLDPWASVEITGWRKSLERTAAFYFTDLGDSYAARTGRPLNVGVIGVAVFQEKAPPIVWRGPTGQMRGHASEPMRERMNDRLGAAQAADAAAADGRNIPMPSLARKEAADMAATPPAAAAPRERADVAQSESRSRDAQEQDKKTLGKLGTGHGRSETSIVTTTTFDRATESPAETVALQYDRRENLIAMGVLPRQHYAQRREPDPFPAGMLFAPDPAR